MKLFELAYCCRLFQEKSTGDAALSDLEAATSGRVDLSKRSHRAALVTWLRRWGCRSLATRDTELTLSALERWWREWRRKLPPAGATLVDGGAYVARSSAAYGSLNELVASYRRASRKKVPVTFGPTASAKALFALRPSFFPPWDDLIRKGLGLDGSAASYARYLAVVSEEARELLRDASALDIGADEIAALAGRPGQSFPKLVDEYLWVKLTLGRTPPTASEVEQWYRWSRERS